MHAIRGEVDRAVEWLDMARKNNDTGLSKIAVVPAFDNLRSNLRWLPFRERVGRAPGQLAAIDFRITCPE